MSLRAIAGLFLWGLLVAAGFAAASASPSLSIAPLAAPTVTQIKPVAVVYFNDGSDISKDHAVMIRNMIHEASSNLGLAIEEYVLGNESEMPGQIEKIADTDTGMIIIIEPRDMDALMKIPGLYPDIKFSVIGISRPLYLTNVRSLLFKEQEGAYLMGVLAALHSRTGTVSFISRHDNDFTRGLAYAFLQGTRYTRKNVQIVERLGDNNILRSSNTSALPNAQQNNADIVFVLNEELLAPALAAAEKQKQLVISYNHALTDEHPHLILTSLLKHYDLAMYHTLRSYKRNEWRAGSESMGIGNSYIDYVLDNENKAFISKEMIEHIEMVKDYVSQGLININELPQ